MTAAGVPRLVFSSTCAVYGQPDEVPIAETAPSPARQRVRRLEAGRRPDDPRLLHGHRTGRRQPAVLQRRRRERRPGRGSRSRDAPDPEHPARGARHRSRGRASTGPTTRRPTAPRSATTSTSRTWPRRTCSRSTARARSEHRVFNLGNGNGFSVREVIAATETVTGREIPHREAPRRPGDPPMLVAASDRIRAELGWEPQQAGARGDGRRRLGVRPGAPRRLRGVGPRAHSEQVGERLERRGEDLVRRLGGVDLADPVGSSEASSR